MDIYGARGAIPLDDLSRMDAHAERYYEEIRRRNSDVQAIATNVEGMGFTVQDIQTVKSHIFLNEYVLEGKKPRRFDPDYDMAVSWQRLIDGRDIREMDVILLQHELLEYSLMSQVISYVQAHEAAERQYSYKGFTTELDKEAGIR